MGAEGKRRVFPPFLAPSPFAFPLCPASRPPSATPPHAARGPYLSSSNWGLARVTRGLARLVAPSGPMARCRYYAGGAWGKQRSGQAWLLGASLASHAESKAKRRLKQRRSAIDPIFIRETAASSQHHTCCDSLFVSINQRWPDIETQLNRNIPNHKVRKLCGAVR